MPYNLTNQDIILIILTIFVLYLMFNQNKTEHFSVSEDVKQAINDIYKADINAIRNLSNVATEIYNNNDSLILPAKNVDLNGNFNLNGNLNLTGNLNFLPRGSIIAFFGSTWPPGWTICDGTNGTPDLRSRFIIGATPGDVEPSKLENGLTTRNLGGNGGEENHTLSINEIPAHMHNFGRDYAGTGLPFNKGVDTNYNTNTTGADDLTGETANTGGSQPHNNLPPYFALFYIMRL